MRTISKKIFALSLAVVMLIANDFTVDASGFKNKAKITNLERMDSNSYRVEIKTKGSQDWGLYVYKYGGKYDHAHWEDYAGSGSLYLVTGLKVNTLYYYQSRKSKNNKSTKKWFIPEIKIKGKVYGKQMKGKYLKFKMPRIKGISYYNILFKKGKKGYKFLTRVSNGQKVTLKYTKKIKKNKYLYFRFIPYMSNGKKVKNCYAGYTGSSKYSLEVWK